jgi:phosphate transport system substrate-binding protein
LLVHRLMGVLLGLLGLTGSALAGDLVVPGTGDGLDILRVVGAAFTADNPETIVIVPPSVHSSGGIAAVRGGQAVLARIARPLTAEETADGLVAIPVFRLPAVFFVNPAANIHDLTADQVVRIYRGEITNWQEFGGTDLRVKIVRREDSDSTFGVLRATMPGWRDLEITERSKTAATTQDAYDIVAEVAGTIGFGPYNRALEASTIVLRIDGRHPIEPGYPSAVTLSLIHRKGAMTSEALSFVRFLSSPKAQTLIKNFGGVPQSPPS